MNAEKNHWKISILIWPMKYVEILIYWKLQRDSPEFTRRSFDHSKTLHIWPGKCFPRQIIQNRIWKKQNYQEKKEKKWLKSFRSEGLGLDQGKKLISDFVIVNVPKTLGQYLPVQSSELKIFLFLLLQYGKPQKKFVFYWTDN